MGFDLTVFKERAVCKRFRLPDQPVTRGGQLPEQHETQDVLPKDLKPQDVLPKDLKPQDVLPKGLKLQTMISEKYWLRASRHQTLPHLVVTLQGAVTRNTYKS